MSDDSLIECRDLLTSISSQIQKNLASMNSKEFIFSLGQNGQDTIIIAGRGSARVFKDNFKKSLAEALYNFSWIFTNEPEKFQLNECLIYVDMFRKLQETEKKLPNYLVQALIELGNKVKI